MKFKVYDQQRKRYLNQDELEEQFYYNGTYGHDSSGEWENISEFRVNLFTGKIQTDHDNSCSDRDCCTPCEMFADDDNFIIELLDE